MQPELIDENAVAGPSSGNRFSTQTRSSGGDGGGQDQPKEKRKRVRQRFSCGECRGLVTASTAHGREKGCELTVYIG